MPMLMLLDTLIGFLEEFFFGDEMPGLAKFFIVLGFIFMVLFTIHIFSGMK